MATGVDIHIVKGDTFNFYGTVYDPTGFPKDISGWTVSGGVKYDIDDTTNAAAFSVTLTDPAKGEFTAALSSTQTGALNSAKYIGGPPIGFYDLRMSNGGEVYTLFHGKVRVEPKVAA